MPARPSPPSWLQAAAVVAAALASIATPPPRNPRDFPAWAIEADRERSAEGLRLRVWVAKSGKEGIALTLRASAPLAASAPASRPLAASAPASRPRLLAVSARLFVAGRPVASAALPAAARIAPGSEQHLHLALPFDNERCWNLGQNEGTLELVVTVDGRALGPWRLPVRQSRLGPHRRLEPPAPPASRPRSQP